MTYRVVDRPGQRDDGFTLVELLITLTLMGLVAGAIGSAMFLGLRTLDDTRRAFDATNTRNLVRSAVIPDLQAVTPSGMNALPLSTAPDCSHTLVQLTQYPLPPDAYDATRQVTYTFTPEDGCTLQRSAVTTFTTLDPSLPPIPEKTEGPAPVAQGFDPNGPVTVAGVTTPGTRPILQLRFVDAGGTTFDIYASSRVG